MQAPHTPATVSGLYDPKVVLEMFKSEGKVEEIEAGKQVFLENETKSGLFSRSDRMYLLLAGEIGLSLGKARLGTVHPGEIFGELASISRLPRGATATATQKSRLISLDTKQLERALQKMPEAALMFMTVIIERLRATLVRLGDKQRNAAAHRGALLDKKLLAELQREFDESKQMRVRKRQVVMNEGDAGVLMYVVLEGEMDLTIRSQLVEKAGPGAVFGEMALVDRSPRSASASAATDACLLAINRNDFLSLIATKPAFGVSLHGLAERLASTTAQLK